MRAQYLVLYGASLNSFFVRELLRFSRTEYLGYYYLAYSCIANEDTQYGFCEWNILREHIKKPS